MHLQVWDILTKEGTGRHSQAEMESVLREDLEAINEILGDNEWLVGDKPTLVAHGFVLFVFNNGKSRELSRFEIT